MTVQGRGFTELMSQRPDIVPAILSTMYQHFHALVAQIEHLKAKSGAQRVADFLLELGPDGAGGVHRPAALRAAKKSSIGLSGIETRLHLAPLRAVPG